MSSQNIVAEVVRSIVNQGKDVLRDHFIAKQKVPPFANKQSASNCHELVAHGGYQSQYMKKYSHFSLKRDAMPENIIKDNLAVKSHQVFHHPKSQIKASPTPKNSHHKYYSSKKKSKQHDNSLGFTPHLEDSSKQKQNQLVKLPENHNNRIIIERVRQRIENEEEKMREKKRLMMLKQYQEKLENEVFQKERSDRQAEKQRILESHMKKGESFRFNFDHDGELMLFQSSNNLKGVYPPQTIFKIRSNQEQEQTPIVNQTKMERRQSLDFRGQIHPLQRNFNENQRIKSARGEAFASAVMKTVNLSRISMNGSLFEVDAQQFMKRNDLFNNNHSRQTSSIPYLQPKVGTVYTEIATNQVVGSNKEPASSTTAHAKQDMSFDDNLKGKAFEGFYQNLDRKYAKTARVIGNRDGQNEDLLKNTSRPIKTAKQTGRNSSNSARRPQTSMNRGRITATNEKLVQSLLQ